MDKQAKRTKDKGQRTKDEMLIVDTKVSLDCARLGAPAAQEPVVLEERLGALRVGIDGRNLGGVLIQTRRVIILVAKPCLMRLAASQRQPERAQISACVENRRIFTVHLGVRKEASPSSNAGEGGAIAGDEHPSWEDRNVPASWQESVVSSRSVYSACDRQSTLRCNLNQSRYARSVRFE